MGHSENRKMKVSITETEAEISSLKKKTSEAKENMKKSGQMVMMVPMMMPNGSQAPGMSQAASFMSQAAPFMSAQAAPFMSQSMNFCSMMPPAAVNQFTMNQSSDASPPVEKTPNPLAPANITVPTPTTPLIGAGENLAHCA